MEKMLKKSILITLLVVFAISSNINSNQDFYDDPELLKLAAGYYGCKTWKNGVCQECSKNFYFSAKGICCQVPEQCMNFNTDKGKCDRCYQGYSLIDGKCLIVNLNNDQAKGCKKWNNQKCVQCAYRYFLNKEKGYCIEIDSNCRAWNQVNGQCKTCYPGYKQIYGKCLIDATLNRPAQNSLCKTWLGNICSQCVPRAYFNDKLVCVLVSDQCKTWDKINGKCLTCYKGYALKGSQCVLEQIKVDNIQIKDSGCAEWDWKNQFCLKCSYRWVFDSKGVCQKVDQNCKKYDQSGVCLECFRGYELTKGVCQLQPPKLQITDPGCAQWDLTTYTCLKCSYRWIFDEKNNCKQVNPLCRQYNKNGACTSCYKSYRLSNGQCVQQNSFQECKTSDENGCTSCYGGYILYKKNCVDYNKLVTLLRNKIPKCSQCSDCGANK